MSIRAGARMANSVTVPAVVIRPMLFRALNRNAPLHGRRTINEVSLLRREWFDGLYADGAATGRTMVLHLHPWIIGQPWRIRHLDAVLGHICARQGVWKATGREIIDWFKMQS